MIKMNAKFIGRGDKSLGLIHGKLYPINISTIKPTLPETGPRIRVEWQEDRDCLYESIVAFLENWDNLNHTD